MTNARVNLFHLLCSRLFVDDVYVYGSSDPACINNPKTFTIEGRDPERTPMQWSCDLNAGFSESPNGTWLPISPDYCEINAEVAWQDETSVLRMYTALIAFRQQSDPLL